MHRPRSRFSDPQGRDLLGRLAAFEQYHYEKLAELARSLQEVGQFIEYETRTVDVQFSASRQPELGRAVRQRGRDLGDLEDMASILSKAIENEKMAGERYRALAEETADPVGQDMFRKLANEETDPPAHPGGRVL